MTVRFLLATMDQPPVKHIYREANSVAHVLAHYASTQKLEGYAEREDTFWGTMPLFAFLNYRKGLLGTTSFRLVSCCKSIELAKILQKKKVNIACVQDTRWVGSKARDADGYKLWYFGVMKSKNGVGILVDRELKEFVVEVRQVNDRLMTIKLVVGECTLNVVSTYVPQMGLDEEVKRCFLDGLDELVYSILPTERLFIGGNFNGHIGSTDGGYGEGHGGFGFGDRNEGGTSMLDFAKAFELVIANSSFPKREENLITSQNTMAKTQIDYLLLRRCEEGCNAEDAGRVDVEYGGTVVQEQR
uniref:Craniofacial development protein 2-like n=1 Tax=Nicotiana tabacum TaxID=4097 RepID=A0A1S3ZXE5_TOBAC|nr:PREDICTED: craniofacial development protein 2-like [Nicotiana tabacum]